MHKRSRERGKRQDYYTIEAAAAYLTIGTTTVYKAVQNREIKHARFEKSIRISHDDLVQWVRDKTKPTLNEITGRKGSSSGMVLRETTKQLFYLEDMDIRELAQILEKKMLAEAEQSE